MMGFPKKSANTLTPKAQSIASNSKAMVRNLIHRKDGTILAGYRLGDARWDFTGRDGKIQRMTSDADVFANLTGREYHERVSTRPHPVQTWAANLDARTPNPVEDIHTCDLSMDRGDLLRGRCGCETWNSMLVRMQERITSTGMDDKVVYRYFSLNTTLSPRADLRKQINAYKETGKASGVLLAI